MNYYEHHLGDYAKDTAHLSMLEHGAYRLLLDRYYSTEAGIPADQAHRVSRARTKEEKQAVDAVLDEFFALVDGTWTNNRAEEEIAKVAAKIPASATKKENEKERQRRARERRKEICDALRGYGIVLPWNSTTAQLQAALDTAENITSHTPVTRDESQSHAPVTASDTAIQSPDTRHQSTDNKPSSPEPIARDESVRVTTFPDPPSDPGHWLQWFNAEHGMSLDPGSRFDRKGFWPLAVRWCKAGVSIGQMQSAVSKAYADAKEPIANLPAYVDRVLASQNTPPPTMTAAAASTLAAARAIFGTDIEGTHAHATGRIIDITPDLAERGDRTDLPRASRQLRIAVSEPMEDRSDDTGRV